MYVISELNKDCYSASETFYY